MITIIKKQKLKDIIETNKELHELVKIQQDKLSERSESLAQEQQENIILKKDNVKLKSKITKLENKIAKMQKEEKSDKQIVKETLKEIRRGRPRKGKK